ncbi:hypothetical protein ACFE04_012696 [Oxalis oulophora]
MASSSLYAIRATTTSTLLHRVSSSIGLPSKFISRSPTSSTTTTSEFLLLTKYRPSKLSYMTPSNGTQYLKQCQFYRKISTFGPVCMGRRSSKIAGRKGAQDAKKAKLYSRIGKEVVSAVKKGGPNPTSNPGLAAVLEKAKELDVPKEIVERNIKRASEKGQEDYIEKIYEVYGYGGVSMVVEVSTDKINRSVAAVRSVVKDYGGKMADSGSVMFKFKRARVANIKVMDVDKDQLLTIALDAGAEDVIEPTIYEDDTDEEGPESYYKVVSSTENYSTILSKLREEGITFETDNGSELLPITTVEADDEAMELNKELMSKLLDLDDVDAVYTDQKNFFTAAASSSPIIQLPSTMETHFWYVVPDEVKSSSLIDQYFQILSPCEKQNVLRMREDHLKKSALLARALVRTTIARYQINRHIDPRSLKFKNNVHGKPEIAWENDENWCPPQLHFNISHTSSLIACGVSVGAPIGIDVEEKHRKTKNNILAFARRYFASHEVKFLSSISDPEVQRQEFIKLWTLKEAYVKAIGRGFSAAPFKSFTIDIRQAVDSDSEATETEIIVESSDDPTNLTNNWQFALLELNNSHYSAICVQKDKTIEGETLAGGEKVPLRLMVRKTIPLMEDEFVSRTDNVSVVGGFVEQY